jgi:hypothetical protein
MLNKTDSALVALINECHEHAVVNVGLKWLVFLIEPLYLNGMWLGEDQRANMIKLHIEKKFDYVVKYLKLLYIQ